MRDFLLALRRSARQPLSTLLVIALVAIVVLSNSTLFSALWTLGARDLPYRDDRQLVELRIDLRDINLHVALAPRLREALQTESAVYTQSIGFPVGPTPAREEDGRTLSLQRISTDFTAVLGVRPLLGSDLALMPERTPSGVLPLLISHAHWQQRYAADPDILGRRTRIGADEYEIVGVMPAAFGFPSTRVDAWTAYRPTPLEREQDAAGSFNDFSVVARLADGVNAVAAQAALQRVLRADPALRALDPDGTRVEADVRPWRERFIGSHWRTLQLLQMAGLLLLVVVAASLANLGLDQVLARQNELATRRALGSDLRDLRSKVLAGVLPNVLFGAILGIALIPAGVALLRARQLLPPDYPLSPGIDGAAVGAAILVAAVLLLASVALALPRSVLEVGRAAGQRTLGTLGRTRRLMLVAQVALSLALVGSAGLLLRSAERLLATDPGFQADGLVLSMIDLSNSDTATVQRVHNELQSQVRALPGARSSALTDMSPFGGSEFVGQVRIPGKPEAIDVGAAAVTPGYFATLGSSIAGRELAAADTDGVVLVDREFQQRWFADGEPIGARIEVLDGEGGARTVEVIGVVPTIKYQSLDEAPRQPMIYQAMANPGTRFYLLSHTRADAGALARDIAQVVRRLAPDARIGLNQSMAQIIELSLSSRTALLEAVLAFAALCLAVAALALYAVLSVSVRRRSAELGLRQAIGARRGHLSLLVLGEGLRLLLYSLLPGLALGVLLGHVLSAQLHQTSPSDALTWAASALVLMLATLLASWLPAARAMRVAPAVVLRAAE